MDSSQSKTVRYIAKHGKCTNGYYCGPPANHRRPSVQQNNRISKSSLFPEKLLFAFYSKTYHAMAFHQKYGIIVVKNKTTHVVFFNEIVVYQ